ncbi:MAG: hypothetical protein ACYST6_11355, partial [Planctomycetota bacterium]
MLEQNVKIPASGPGSYKVFVGSRVLHSLWARIETDFPRLARFVVTDQNLVSAGHLSTLLGSADPS